MLGHLVPYVLPMGGARLSRTLKYGALLVMLGSTGAFLLPVLRRWDCSLRLFVGLFPCVYAMLYTVANPAVFEWYAVPLVPFLAVSVVIGSYEVLERLAGDHGDLFRKVMRPTLTMCIIGILVAGMREVNYLWLHDAREGRELAYEVISKELSTRCLADCVVAAPEIGTLGWYIPNARILDTQGLVSPEVIPYRKQALSEITDSADLESLKRISAKVPESLILRFKPTFLVSPDAFTRGLGGSNGFGRSYRLLMREASEIFGSTGIVVYERVPD